MLHLQEWYDALKQWYFLGSEDKTTNCNNKTVLTQTAQVQTYTDAFALEYPLLINQTLNKNNQTMVRDTFS